RVRQRRSYRDIVDRLEEAEEADLIVMCFVVETIVNGGDPTDGGPIPLSQEIRGFGVFEKRILARRQQHLDIPTQRRDP
ncbi:MAG: hypothetical protein ACYC2K_13720, partial [Gemmatimonadales bacterium]